MVRAPRLPPNRLLLRQHPRYEIGTERHSGQDRRTGDHRNILHRKRERQRLCPAAQKAVRLADLRISVVQKQRQLSSPRRKGRRKRGETPHAEKRLRPETIEFRRTLFHPFPGPEQEFQGLPGISGRRRGIEAKGLDSELCRRFRLFFRMGAAEEQNRCSPSRLQFAGNAEPGIEVSAGASAADCQSFQFH